MMNTQERLSIILQNGEGQQVEFKEMLSNLERELVAFANSQGGSIFLGINDKNLAVGIEINNKLLSQIQDIARNCDPPVNLKFNKIQNNILEILVPEGKDKPYSCKNGFYLRNGPNSQKLKRDEVLELILSEGKFHFDENICENFEYKNDFDKNKFKHYLQLVGIDINLDYKDLLINMDLVKQEGKKILFKNATVLFFAKRVEHFFPESYLTCVRYQHTDRLTIIDKQDIFGDPITLIEEGLKFIKRNISVKYLINKKTQREEFYDYPIPALREALTNAVTHRDYYYDASHIYVHIFSDRLEIENPGGLFKSMTIEELGHRSIRRNRTIADLMMRARYVERVGSGIERIKSSLSKNSNPPFIVTSTNFFVMRFYKRLDIVNEHFTNLNLTLRQQKLLHLFSERKKLTKQDCRELLAVGEDTVLREINVLLKKKIITKEGKGKNTYYIYSV
ncbi:MAG: putative DNA binding domain-containing protein [Oligoflexia bacterium]|nr:putative DNA binding domain-containing protein [Oligoflexia bacterium]